MSDTGPAQLPGIPAYRTTDTALAAWMQVVQERLEVREGARGNAAEKVVLQRDLDAYIASVKPVTTTASGEVDVAALIKQIIEDPVFLAALPKAETRSWVDELRASIEGIRARLAGLMNSVAAEPLFSKIFFWGSFKDPAFVSRGNQWVLRSETGLESVAANSSGFAAFSVQDVLNCISAGFSGQVSTGIVKLRDDIQINNVSTSYVQTLGSIASTVVSNNNAIWEYSQWFTTLGSRFDSSGRLLNANMPLAGGLYEIGPSIMAHSARLTAIEGRLTAHGI